MRALLEIQSGHQASRRLLLARGRRLRVGSSAEAEVMVPRDERLAPLHFSLLWDGAVCRLQVPPGTGGVVRNGEEVTEAELQSGDSLRAGETWFAVWLRPYVAEHSSPPLSWLEQELRDTEGSLFALLDAARDERVLKLLRTSDEESQSLYEGLQGQVLSEQAPYLVRLTPESEFLTGLLREGWGRSWGVFLSSDRPFAEVRRHFRRFLFASDEKGRRLYFRFYDPRVLRKFLPACGPSQAEAFFDGVGEFLAEDEHPGTLLRLGWAERQVRTRVVRPGSECA